MYVQEPYPEVLSRAVAGVHGAVHPPREVVRVLLLSRVTH